MASAQPEEFMLEIHYLRVVVAAVAAVMSLVGYAAFGERGWSCLTKTGGPRPT